ncbi:MAG: hypothetical protein J07HX64_01248 [halophilic archaeon J07HX64]|nr:MAG: hypothetical protein J07HX64_01248 [halophilic archaeon J07HX64]
MVLVLSSLRSIGLVLIDGTVTTSEAVWPMSPHVLPAIVTVLALPDTLCG